MKRQIAVKWRMIDFSGLKGGFEIEIGVEIRLVEAVIDEIGVAVSAYQVAFFSGSSLYKAKRATKFATPPSQLGLNKAVLIAAR